MKPGDRVAFKASFLRSVGDYTRDPRGTVVQVDFLVTVDWDSGHRSQANIDNLILERDIPTELP